MHINYLSAKKVAAVLRSLHIRSLVLQGQGAQNVKQRQFCSCGASVALHFGFGYGAADSTLETDTSVHATLAMHLAL